MLLGNGVVDRAWSRLEAEALSSTLRREAHAAYVRSHKRVRVDLN